ncbi:MAG: hypothetical protein RR945_11110 [Erysipelotrichaceae bacterium]
MSSQLIFKAKLLNIETGSMDGKQTMRLIFKSQRFDRGLQEWVPSSQNVKVVDEHHHLKDFYLQYCGQEIYLPIELTSMDRNIFYKTTGDGKPLMLEVKKSEPPVKIA